MKQMLKGAGRLAAMLLVMGASAAFGAMYTFDLTTATRQVNGSFTVGANEDSGVQIQLTALVTAANVAGQVVLNSDGAGVTASSQGGSGGPGDQIKGGPNGEALIITPLTGTAFAIQSVTFTNTENTDDASIYLDDPTALNAAAFNIDIGTTGSTFNWVAPGSTTFTTNVAFRSPRENDDFKVSEIVLDITVGEVPEPSTWTLFGIGIAGLAWLRRRKQS